MAKYHFDPVWQLCMMGLYVLSVVMSAHALLGAVRTFVVKLPLRRNAAGSTVALFPGDYTLKLHDDDFDGPVRKLRKMAQLGGVALVGAASWLVVLIVTYRADDPWFGWTLQHDTLVAAVHALGFMTIGVLAGARGGRKAHLYEARGRTT